MSFFDWKERKARKDARYEARKAARDKANRDPVVLLRRAKSARRMAKYAVFFLPLWSILAAILYPMHKANLEARRAHYEEVRERAVYVEVLRTKWNEGEFTYEGKRYRYRFPRPHGEGPSLGSRVRSGERQIGNITRIRIDPENITGGAVRHVSPDTGKEALWSWPLGGVFFTVGNILAIIISILNARELEDMARKLKKDVSDDASTS